jgi:hypothetical protein
MDMMQLPKDCKARGAQATITLRVLSRIIPGFSSPDREKFCHVRLHQNTVGNFSSRAAEGQIIAHLIQV